MVLQRVFGFLWNALTAVTPSPSETFREETSDLSFTSGDAQPFIGPVKPTQLTKSCEQPHPTVIEKPQLMNSLTGTERNLPFWLPHWILPFITPTRYTELKCMLSSAAMEAVEVLIDKVIDEEDPSRIKPSKNYWDTTSNPDKFKGLVIIHGRDHAKEFSLRVYSDPSTRESTHRHIFWTDASICGTNIAGAVVWRESAVPEKWAQKTYGRKCAPGEGPGPGEIMAIAMALEIAIARISQVQASLPTSEVILQDRDKICHTVQVFSDSEEALQFIGCYPSKLTRKPIHSQQAHMVLSHTTTLRELGAVVELHLVPGHNGVPGNILAHRVAKNTARQLAQWSKEQEERNDLQKTQGKAEARKAKNTEERREKKAQKRARYKARKKAKREMMALGRVTAGS